MYKDNIIILGETEDNVRLINSEKSIGLHEQKTKYLIMSWREYVQSSLMVGDFIITKQIAIKKLSGE